MSRGLGKCQRFILAELERPWSPTAEFRETVRSLLDKGKISHAEAIEALRPGQPREHTLWTLAIAWNECKTGGGWEGFSASEYETVRRAVRSLEERGLISLEWDLTGGRPYLQVFPA